ncbi:hypothetical protein R5K32_15265 [Acinetobacter baumannii]|uniref:hypothetical protein n=1 Tax=Acinetobacter baumannii TaxID=470 RepID=UPI002236A3C5|nr:hypothetical protein [Acinetobacter baumannii]MDW2811496.1 hypothetical protein [Acinetobacter baumannii]UZG64176.1 hypothetical protein OMP06_19445 [Acinetobacter baumannii]
MGDRVCVYVRVHESHKEEAMRVFEHHCPQEWQSPYASMIEIELPEVNYADISDESEALTSLGIPHTYSWAQGGEYDAGEGYVIFDEHSKPIAESYYDGDKNIPPQEILKLIRSGASPRKIEAFVEDYVKTHTLPTIDDEQLKRGRVYRLKQIVIG